MRTLFLQAALLAVCGPAAVSAQGWADLPFGTSVAHVRVVLSRQPPICTVPSIADDKDCNGLTMEPLPGEGDYTIKPQRELWLGALNAPLHFKTLLHFFNADRQLARIDLSLDTDRYKAEGRPASELVDLAGEPVLAELLGKYGVPLEMSTACEPAEARRLVRGGADVIDCNVLWKAQGNQKVNLAWKYQSNGAYSLVVRYTALLSGL